MRGEPPQSPDDQDGDSAVKGDKPSLTSVPKAKKKNGSTDGSGLEPEPSA